MSTATAEVIDSLQSTIEPMESLHGEHSLLEGWVHDSFAALEKLHCELTEWQSELARKQTEVDLREDAVMRSESETVSGDAEEQIAHWKTELTESREEVQQVEQENAEQLQELENLELSLVHMEKELQDAHKSTLELNQMLESERSRSTEEQRQWQGEFRDMRLLMEKQSTLLEDRIRDSRESSEGEEGAATEAGAAGSNGEFVSRTAELRRRAKARLAAKLRKHQDTESDSSSKS